MFKVLKFKPFSEKAIKDEFRNCVRRTAHRFRVEFFESTTITWTHQPKFIEHTSVVGKTAQLGFTIDTEDDIWNWIENGTGLYGPDRAKYPIEAGFWTGKSDKKALAFASMFEPKTTPNNLGSGPGYVGERDTVLRKVMHPGIEPRHFVKAMKKKAQREFREEMLAALRRGVAKCGQPVR